MDFGDTNIHSMTGSPLGVSQKQQGSQADCSGVGEEAGLVLRVRRAPWQSPEEKAWSGLAPQDQGAWTVLTQEVAREQ